MQGARGVGENAFERAVSGGRAAQRRRPFIFAAQVDATRAGFSDGINFDFEDPLSAAGAPYGRNALAFHFATGVVRQSRGERSAMQIGNTLSNLYSS